MPAVNPLHAIVAPAALASRASRQEYVPQDLLSAGSHANTGLAQPSQDQGKGEDATDKSFARVLEEGMQRQSEKRESRRSTREEATRRADADRKEDAAAQADSGRTLPQTGRPLPPAEAAGPALAASAAEEKLLAAAAEESAQADGQATVVTALDGKGQPEMRPVTAAVLAPVTTTEPSLPATTATPLSGQLDSQATVASTQLPTGESAGLGAVESGTTRAGDSALTSAASPATAPLPDALPSAQAVAFSQPGDAAADAGVPVQSDRSQADTQGAGRSTNPFAALASAMEVDARQAAQTSEQQAAVTQQAQTTASARAQASGAEPSTLLEVTPGQGDLAERVRAWRGLSGGESMASPSLFARSEGAGSSLFSQTSGQLQQFADSLRLAVNQAEAPSLLPAAERTASSTATTVAPGALSSAASTTSSEPGGAWRADNLQMSTVTGGARPAAGTLQFMQTMQPSSFGATLGETFGQNAWAESVTQRVALMTGQKLSSARIELDPPELGAMTVKVSLSGDQASVSFASPHAIVREALEQTFPRLQEMLNQQGLQLADAQVSDQSAERRQSGESAAGSAAEAAQREADGIDGVATQNVKLSSSLIDYYA